MDSQLIKTQNSGTVAIGLDAGHLSPHELVYELDDLVLVYRGKQRHFKCVCEGLFVSQPVLSRHVATCEGAVRGSGNISTIRCGKCLSCHESVSRVASHFSKCSGTTESLPLSRRLRSSAQVVDVTDSGAKFKCRFCDRCFTTKQGQGLHELRGHHVEKAASEKSHTRPRWSRAEIDMLVEAEAKARNELGLEATGSDPVILEKVVSDLKSHPHFVRTTDGILGRRTHGNTDAYQRAVRLKMDELALRSASLKCRSQIQASTNEVNQTECEVTEPSYDPRDQTVVNQCLSASLDEDCGCSEVIKHAVEEHLESLSAAGSKSMLGVLRSTMLSLQSFNIGEFIGKEQVNGGNLCRVPGAPMSQEEASRKRHLTGRVRNILEDEGPKRCLQFLRHPFESGKCSRETVDLFKGVFEKALGPVDCQPYIPVQSKRDSHMVHGVIIASEITGQLKIMNKLTAPGPDGVRIKDLLLVKPADIACLFNIFLLHGDVPKTLKQNKTTMIPKSSEPGPGDWRPITISSVLDRLFAKVLEARLSASIELDPRQKGFIKEQDGCGDNIVAYSGALRYARLRGKPIVITSIDLAKAFDSVQYTSIKRSLERLSIDNKSIRLIMNLCHGHSTVIKYSQGVETVLLNQGVRQGWPLSPLLFLCVIDELLSELNDADGFHAKDCFSEEHSLTGRAFADDLIVYSDSVIGMQRQVTRVEEWCSRRGLRVNPKKSSVLYLESVPRQKKVRLSSAQISIDGVEIPVVSDSFERVLGVHMSFDGKVDHRIDSFQDDLNLVCKSALRPTQKLRMVSECLVPM